MRLILISLIAIAVHAQPQDLRTYFDNLLKAPIPEGNEAKDAFDNALKISERVKALPKDQVAALLPLIFAATMDKNDGYKHAAVSLFVVSTRPDSGELLRPHLQDIAKMFNHPNPARKATAGQLLLNMYPPPPEAAEILLTFINAPADSNNPVALNEKIDALAILTRLPIQPKERTEAAVVAILTDPSLGHRKGAAINASVYRGSTDRVLDLVGHHLTDPDQDVQLQALYGLRGFPAAVARHRAAIAKIANDPKSSDRVKAFAQDTLDNKKP